MKFNADKLRSPLGIFLIYVIISFLLIMIFRFIFPPVSAPLLIFSVRWRLISGVLEIFNLFPALVLSALVVPFGIVSHEADYSSFSQVLFKRLIASVIIAISSAVIYCIIFFLAFPLVNNYKENLVFKGKIYNLAKEHAYERSREGSWQEASGFLGICDRIWPESSELSNLRTEIIVNLSERQFLEIEERALARVALRSADLTPLAGELSDELSDEPMDAVQALTMSREAFAEKRYYDAHWLAVIGGRLAARNSLEAVSAAQLASEAWNMINSQAPSLREERLYSLFEMKLSGYQAMNEKDWIRAYYIFLELSDLTPDDPDAARFLALCEQGARENAFFIDEMELSLGEILTGAVFSLPYKNGRSVLRFGNLSASLDFAFGGEFEYMEFDEHLNPVSSVRSRYAKLLPVIINGRNQIMVMTHALSRYDKDAGWEGQWLVGEKPPAGVILDISFEDFLLLSAVRRGLPSLQIDELFLASRKLGSAGYISQIFEAEVLNRLGSAVFFLPAAIFVIVLGWRFRTKTKPRYLFILLLPVLPVIFHGFVNIYRTILNNLGIWLTLSIGFSSALIVFSVVLALSFFISLITLAAQHGR